MYALCVPRNNRAVVCHAVTHAGLSWLGAAHVKSGIWFAFLAGEAAARWGHTSSLFLFLLLLLPLSTADKSTEPHSLFPLDFDKEHCLQSLHLRLKESGGCPLLPRFFFLTFLGLPFLHFRYLNSHLFNTITLVNYFFLYNIFMNNLINHL